MLLLQNTSDIALNCGTLLFCFVIRRLNLLDRFNLLFWIKMTFYEHFNVWVSYAVAVVQQSATSVKDMTYLLSMATWILPGFWFGLCCTCLIMNVLSSIYLSFSFLSRSRFCIVALVFLAGPFCFLLLWKLQECFEYLQNKLPLQLPLSMSTC